MTVFAEELPPLFYIEHVLGANGEVPRLSELPYYIERAVIGALCVSGAFAGIGGGVAFFGAERRSLDVAPGSESES